MKAKVILTFYSIDERMEIFLSHEYLGHQWVSPKEAREMDLIPGGIEALEIYCRRRALLFNMESDEN